LMQQQETGLSRIYVARYSSPVDAFELAKEVAQLEEVEYAEPWFIYPVESDSVCPSNDTSFTKGKQWALTRIKADSAWCHSSGDTTKVIGIIDTGVQWDHPDLYANIWLNPGEDAWSNPNDPSSGNGIDDDNNGKVDDWRGWDFGGATYQNPAEDNNPISTTGNVGHGTHVAGIASAATNNTTGIAGVGYNCRILPIKTASDNDARGQGGNAFIVFGFQGIKYATDVHADVVNCSWGGAGYSQFEQDVIDYASEHGTLVVAAAGNSGAREAQYPAAYRGVISVAARTEATAESKASYSTYHSSVDVSAPGASGGSPPTSLNNILSTYVGSSYALLSGTSMAAPHVAGLVALVKSRYPWMSSVQAGEQVRVTSDPKENTAQYLKLMGKGRINAHRAIKDDGLTSPSVRLIAFTLIDTAGNSNGIPDPGETIDLLCTFKNYLKPTSAGATVNLVSSDANKIQVITGAATLDSISTLGEKELTFKIKIGSSVATNLVHELRFDFSDGTYSDFQWIELLLNPLFVSHKSNNVAFSVSNFGSLGYFDYTQGSGVSYGDGFQYPIGDPSSLFHATLMVATDSNHVVDNAFGNPSNTTAVDWKLAHDGIFKFPTEPGAENIIQCAFTDSGAGASRIGLKVLQRSYAYSTSPDNDYVMLRYDIRNMRTDTIKNAYVGIYADWDVGDVNENKTSYDSTRNLGYMWDSVGATNYFGVSLLTS
ncbi:MAG: S8 family serine peptidase, partial [Ignavibacteriales bacterium]|nr:S8 family serine peptidase [Ignavibacteriales bacterium]